MIAELQIPETHELIGDALVSSESVLRFLDISSPRTLSALIADGTFPPADCKLGRENRWFASTLREWLVELKDERIRRG